VRDGRPVLDRCEPSAHPPYWSVLTYSRDRTISVPRSHSPTRTCMHACTQAVMRACTRVRLHTQTHPHTHCHSMPSQRSTRCCVRIRRCA
jgi:hypothetical protein